MEVILFVPLKTWVYISLFVNPSMQMYDYFLSHATIFTIFLTIFLVFTAIA